MMHVFAVFVVLAVVARECVCSRRDGVLFITSISVDFLEPSFSKASLMPPSATFSLLKSSDSISNLCSSHLRNIVPPQPFLFTDPVGEGAGLVVTHSNCSIYEEASNAYLLGYSYLVVLGDYSSDWISYSTSDSSNTAASSHIIKDTGESDIEERLLRPLETELRKLEIFVAIVSKEDYERAIYLSSRYQNSISQPLRREDEIKETVLKFSRQAPDVSALRTCHVHISRALAEKRSHYLRASAYSCLDAAISSFQQRCEGCSVEELNKSVQLATALWNHEYADEATLLTNWLISLLFTNHNYNYNSKTSTKSKSREDDNTRHSGKNSDSDYVMSSERLTAQLHLSALLFQTGEWSTARQLLEKNILEAQVCAHPTSSEEGLPEMIKSNRKHCQESCSLLFLSSFATLETNAHIHDYSGENEDWTVEVETGGLEEVTEAFGQQPRTPSVFPDKDRLVEEREWERGVEIGTTSALQTCLRFKQNNSHFENIIVNRENFADSVDKASSDETATSWVELISARYGAHSSLWLAASELKYLANKWGLLNVMRYVATVVEDTCVARGTCSSWSQKEKQGVGGGRRMDDSLRSSTSHMSTFLRSLDTTLATCNKDVNINTQRDRESKQQSRPHDTDLYCRRSLVLSGPTAVFQLADMPHSSYDILKQYANSRNKKTMRRTGLRMFQNDASEVHTRLTFYWRDYGAFATSQNHFLARVARIQCLSKNLRGDISKSKQKDLCSPAQVKLLKAEVGDIGCLYQQNVMATPAIFGTNEEFSIFRQEQLKHMVALQTMIFPLIDVSYDDTIEKEFNGSYIDTASSLSSSLASGDGDGSTSGEVYTGELLSTLQERYFLMADERKLSDTPAGISVGYTFELQEIIKALAPSSAVTPTGAVLLTRGHAMLAMCEHSGVSTSYLPPPPAAAAVPSLTPTVRVRAMNDDDDEGVQNTKIKVGFISRFFYDHPVGNMVHSLITGLNASLFDIHVVCICCDPHMASAASGSSNATDGYPQILDHVQRALTQAPHLFWTWLGGHHLGTQAAEQLLPQASEQCRRQLSTSPVFFQQAAYSISALDLDLLLYPELGLDRQTLSFAQLRLATIQGVLPAHPISQRLSTMDYFFSSELYVSHNPRCEFPRLHEEKCPFAFTSSEQVILLAELPQILRDTDSADDAIGNSEHTVNPFSALFDSLVLPTGTIDRMDKHVYLLPHPITSYSTVFVRAIASILLKDPIGFVVILYHPSERFWYEKLRRSIHYHIKKLDCHTNKVDRATSIIKHFPEMHTYVTQKDCIATPDQAICKLCCECSDVTYAHATARRLVLLPHPPSPSSATTETATAAYRNYIHHSSVVLDPFPVGMEVTAAAEVLTMGRPIITLPTLHSVPSAVHGLLRQLDVNTSVFVAGSVNEYVTKAIQVSQRSAGRDALMRQLQEMTRERVYGAERQAVVLAEWEKVLIRLGTHYA